MNKSPRYIARRRTNPIRSLEVAMEKLCRTLCRMIWQGKCGICGKGGSSAHHHFRKSICAAVKYDLRNLIYLCDDCHSKKIHHEGRNILSRKAIINRIGQEEFDKLEVIANRELGKFTLDSLKALHDSYFLMLNDVNALKEIHSLASTDQTAAQDRNIP